MGGWGPLFNLSLNLSRSKLRRWRRKWQPTPVFLPGEFHGQRSLVGSSPWGLRDGYDWATITLSLTHSLKLRRALSWWLSSKESACSAEDAGDAIQSLGLEGPLEEGVATHSSILVWRISWTQEHGGLHFMGATESWTWLK